MTRPEVLAAVPTLFAADGSLDLPANRRLNESLTPWLDGVFVAGTTGEFPALSDGERLALFDETVQVWGPDRVIAHVGSAATSQAVTLTRNAATLGLTRFAALPPHYFAVDEDDIVRHYATVRTAAGTATLYGYLFAERTSVDMSPQLLARLVADGSVLGAKISGAAVGRLADYAAAVPAGTSLWAGADVSLPEMTAAGARGVVSGLAAVAPRQVASIARAIADGDAELLSTSVTAVQALTAEIGVWPAGLKAALSHLGLGTATCRMLQGAESRFDDTAAARAVLAL